MTRKVPLEKHFQKKFIASLENEYGDACRITVNDPQKLQGIPDLTMVCYFPDEKSLYWKDFELKRKKKSPKRPNQNYYVSKNGVFVSPENHESVLDEIRFEISEARRRSRVFKP